MLVFFGVGGTDEMSVFDTGKSRTSVDSARVLGVQTDTRVTATITQAHGLAKKTRVRSNLSHTQVNELHLRYGDDAHKVHAWYAGQRAVGVDRAPVRAAVLAALICGVDERVLERFVGVLCDRVPATEPGDKAAVALRQVVQKMVKRNSGGGNGVGYTLYMFACRAILHAAEGHDTAHLKQCSESPFILPENT